MGDLPAMGPGLGLSSVVSISYALPTPSTSPTITELRGDATMHANCGESL
jgi:hypothetical protein